MFDKKFVDTNIFLYRLFRNSKTSVKEQEEKHKIATQITQQSNIVISTQVINEISVNLLKKAKFKEFEIKAIIVSLFSRYEIVAFDLNILIKASDLRNNYSFSFWDSLIIACALSSNSSIIYSEDMQHGLIIENQLTVINPFEQESAQ